MLKRVMALAMVLAMMSSTALADWVCAVCAQSNHDLQSICDECGQEQPLHLFVESIGISDVAIVWHGFFLCADVMVT